MGGNMSTDSGDTFRRNMERMDELDRIARQRNGGGTSSCSTNGFSGGSSGFSVSRCTSREAYLNEYVFERAPGGAIMLGDGGRTCGVSGGSVSANVYSSFSSSERDSDSRKAVSLDDLKNMSTSERRETFANFATGSASPGTAGPSYTKPETRPEPKTESKPESKSDGVTWADVAKYGGTAVGAAALGGAVVGGICRAQYRAELDDERKAYHSHLRRKDEQISSLKDELRGEIERAEELLSGKSEAEDAHEKTRVLLEAAKRSLVEKDASLSELRQIKSELEEQLSELQSNQSLNFR